MKTCNTCEWFVEERKSNKFDHKLAKENGKGFCLIQDLYTMVEPKDEACNEYAEEKKE